MGGYAWVTLATNDSYSLGALVLAHSLRRAGTKHDLVCMVTPGVTTAMRERLAAMFSLVQEVNVLDSKDEANLALLARPELGITFTKLHCWRLTQYEKCVFIDADALVVQNCDELFEREELSAAPDVGWPDCFNSGVFVFRPSQQTFASITAFAAARGSFDGGDQGLLNIYFSDWATKDISKHLPFIYNMCSTATYSYLPAFKQFGENVKIIHFIGITKPWLQYFDNITGVVQPPPGSGHLQSLLQLWWNIFCERVHSQLSPSMTTSSVWCVVVSPPSSPSTISADEGMDQDISLSDFNDPWESDSAQSNSSPIRCEADSTTPISSHEYEMIEMAQNERETVIHQPITDGLPIDTIATNCHPIAISNIYQLQEPSYQLVYPYQQNTAQHTIQHNQPPLTPPSDHSQSHSEQHENHPMHDESTMQYEYKQYQHIEHYNQLRMQGYEPVLSIRYHEQQQHSEQNNGQCNAQHSDPQFYTEQSQSHDYYRNGDRRNDTNGHHARRFSPYQSPRASCSNERRRRSTGTLYENYGINLISDDGNHDIDNNNESNPSYTTQSSHVVSNEPFSRSADDLSHIWRDPYPPPFQAHASSHNVATSYDLHVTEYEADEDAGIAGVLADMRLGEARSAEQIALEDQMRKQSWEQGLIDYMGRDSFDNIWKKICETLARGPIAEGPIDLSVTPRSTDSIDAERREQAAEADKDPTQRQQSLVCQVTEKLPAPTTTCEIGAAGNIVVPPEILGTTEQKTPVLPSEESLATETAATTVSSEPALAPATQDAICAITKPVEPRETSTEVPSSKPTVDSSLAEVTAEQCKLASPMTQDATSPDKSESAQLPAKDSQPAGPLVSACLLTDAVCKSPAQEAPAPVAQPDSAPATPIEDKSQPPASVIPDVTQPIAITQPTQPISVAVAAFAAPSESVQDTAKRLIEPAADVTRPLTIDPSERHAEMLLTASEVSTVSPVPIQVAESVLQTEPKESVLDAAAVASGQAIATTITAVEVAATTAAKPEERAVQLNGSASGVEKRDGDVATIAAVPSHTEMAAAIVESVKEPASDSATTKDAPSEARPAPAENIEFSSSAKISSEKIEKPAEPVEQAAGTGTMESAAQVATPRAAETECPKQIAKTEATEVKPAQQVAKTETAEEKCPEQVAKVETTGAIARSEITAEAIAKAETTEIKSKEPIEQTTKAEAVEAAKSPGEVPESPIAEQEPPTESIEAKALDIPSTPTVIEATPPTSPSVESALEAEGQDKAAKKGLKKSDSADGTDGEGAGKGAKKTVKKITKKPKSSKPEETVAPAAEAAAVGADNSQGKAKKTVKVAKKTGVKTGQSLEADTTVPETPPPPTPSSTTTATADAPVPPKRKTKSTPSAKGTTGKKSEAEE